MSQLLRVHNFTVSSDGFGAGDGQSLETPFGSADPRELMSWFFGTASGPLGAGSRGLDDYMAREFDRNIGAEIMGAHKFGPHRGPWTDETCREWQGWWGDEPPFHTPVFVMTHHLRPSFSLSDTTFHFVDDSPAAVLEQARAAADGKDVRLGGGAQTVRQFLDADLVDTLHVAVAPVEIGSGTRLWESPDELRDRYEVDVVPSPSGVTHYLFWR